MTIEAVVAEALRLQLGESNAQVDPDHPEDHPPVEVGPYLAFISYSHDDGKVAAELHRCLERFRVPRSIPGYSAESGDLPRRIRPIFRDQDEFPASADLGRSIREALRAARTLVVVCSPRSAVSAWVGEEIRFFKRLGRGARILCFIIEGSPSAINRKDQAPAALHSALRECYDEKGNMLSGTAPEPLAVDVRETGFDTAVTKIAAGILGVSYEALYQRVRRQQRRRFAALAVLISAVLAALLGLYVDGVREKQRNLAHELAVVARQQLFDKDPVAGMALALHALAIAPDGTDDEMLRKNARALLSQGRIASLGSDIEDITFSPDGTRLVLHHQEGVGEIRSGMDGSLQHRLPRNLRSSGYYGNGEGYFLLQYDLSSAELRNAVSGAQIARLKSPVLNIDFGPRHIFVRYSGYPDELRRISDGGVVRFDSDARLSTVQFGTGDSDLMVISFHTPHEPQLRRMSDEARLSLIRRAEKIELSRDLVARRLLVTYEDGSVELLRSTDLSLVRRFSDPGAPSGFWSHGARLLSFRTKSGSIELIDITNGSSIASGSGIRRSRDPERSLVGLISADEVNWYSAAAGTKLGSIAGQFDEIRFSRDTPPSHIALGGATGWQLYRLADGGLVSSMPGVVAVSMDADYLVTSNAKAGESRPDSDKKVRRLDSGSVVLALNNATDRVNFVQKNLALVESRAGSRRYYQLPSGRPAKVPARRNIEFDAPLGPGLTFHMIRYTDGRTEIRAGVEGPTVAWINRKIAQPSHISFLPEDSPSHILVMPPDTPSAIQPLMPVTVQPMSDRAGLRVALPSAVAQFDLLPVGDAYYLIFRYADGSAELWKGLRNLRRLALLRANLKSFFYSEPVDRLIILYAGGQADILDPAWLERASEPGLSDQNLFELACAGPLRRLDSVGLEKILQGRKWMGCNDVPVD